MAADLADDPLVRVVAVTAERLVLSDPPSGNTEVRFDGQRILAIKSADFRSAEAGATYAWPRDLRRFLHGSTRLVLRDLATDLAVVDEDVSFDERPGRTAVVDAAGHPLAVDKSGGVSRMFDSADPAAVRELLLTAQRLADDVVAFGADAFIGYGTLLGAVRNGHLIGHDNDVDLIWFSRNTAPTEVVRESLALERFLTARGWDVDRARASFIRVQLSGELAGNSYLDLFLAFHDGSRLYVDRFLWADVPVDAITPTGTVVVEGVEMAAPADPARLLSAIYGPSYLVPDPTFAHARHRARDRATAAWFGNYRRNRPEWRLWQLATEPPTAPSELARLASARLAPGGLVVDAGCGHGTDSAWLAACGHHVVAIDHVLKPPPALQLTGNAVDFRSFSFCSVRHSLVHAARLAALPTPGPAVVMARDLLDVLNAEARANFWLFARAVLGQTGTLLVSVRTQGAPWHEPGRQAIDPHRLLAEGEQHGARVLQQSEAAGRVLVELTFSPV